MKSAASLKLASLGKPIGRSSRLETGYTLVTTS